jgi:biopolymer transport protein ExbD
MADIEIKNKKGRRNPKTGASKSIRVDLTPMVDLGFLLITFFVFTTTMAKATVMEMVQPRDGVSNDLICNSCVLTLILGQQDAIWYYEGAFEKNTWHTATYHSIRDVIQQKKKSVAAVRNSKNAFVLIVKASDGAAFKNFVDIADEVTINAIPRYYIDELTIAEKKKLQQLTH